MHVLVSVLFTMWKNKTEKQHLKRAHNVFIGDFHIDLF